MSDINRTLLDIFDRIPRRHTTENVKEMNTILDEYEEALQAIESINEYYEKNISFAFDAVENVRSLVKKSNDNKLSKKNKDAVFDDASVALKDSVQEAIDLYENGTHV